MSFRTKLLLSLSPLVVSLAALSILSVNTVSQLGTHSQEILKDNYRSVLATERMKESLERIDSAALFVIAGKRQAGESLIERHRLQFEHELKVQEGNITESGEKEATAGIRTLWTQYEQHLDSFLSLRPVGELKAKYFESLESTFQSIKKAADAVLTMNQDAMVRKSDAVRQLSMQMKTLILGAALGTFLAGLFLSMALIRKFLRPLSVLSQAVRRMGEGDLEVRASLPGRDEIARLASEFNFMAERLNQYRQSTLGELLQAQEASQAAIDSLPDPVLVFGPKGELLNINQAAETFLGSFSPGGSTNPMSGLTPDIQTALDKVKDHVLSGKGPYHPQGFEEALKVTEDNEDRYFLCRGTPLRNRKKEIMGVSIILQDVTRLKHFDRLKSNLVATVAHEFRTPLTSLRMAVLLSLEQQIGTLNERQKELMLAAREDCERLQVMVDDLLDLSRLQGGGAFLERRPIPSLELVNSAIAAYRAEAGEKGIDLDRFNETIGEDVLADSNRIQRVFGNLIENAIRHTPRGGSVLIRILPFQETVRFEVLDNGEGVSMEHQPFLFDRFYRVPGTTSPGAGLGLSIAKEIVTSHGGEIGVVSEFGMGATFWFTLPRAHSEPQKRGEKP